VGLVDDVINGVVIKSVVFGWMANWIAVFEGYDAIPTSEGISLATTPHGGEYRPGSTGIGFRVDRHLFRSLGAMGTLKKLELAVGIFVALGLTAFFMLAMKVSNIAELGEDKGYKITARFENIGGLKVRAPVTLGGVRIGRVAVSTWTCAATKRWSPCPSNPNTISCRRIPTPAS